MKTTPGMLGSYSYDVVSREVAEVFVRRSDVWWYAFPVEDETLDGSSWKKGGAWAQPPEAGNDVAAAVPLEAYGNRVSDGLDRERPAVPRGSQVVTEENEDDEDDGRWG
ncbi:MAG TPA: hypothetical protein VGG75_38130 [Trebonia sp.]